MHYIFSMLYIHSLNVERNILKGVEHLTLFLLSPLWTMLQMTGASRWSEWRSRTSSCPFSSREPWLLRLRQAVRPEPRWGNFSKHTIQGCNKPDWWLLVESYSWRWVRGRSYGGGSTPPAWTDGTVLPPLSRALSVVRGLLHSDQNHWVDCTESLIWSVWAPLTRWQSWRYMGCPSRDETRFPKCIFWCSSLGIKFWKENVPHDWLNFHSHINFTMSTFTSGMPLTLSPSAFWVNSSSTVHQHHHQSLVNRVQLWGCRI